VILAAAALALRSSRSASPQFRVRILIASTAGLAVGWLVLASSLSASWLLHRTPLDSLMRGHHRHVDVPAWLGAAATLWLALVALRLALVWFRLRASRAAAFEVAERSTPLDSKRPEVRVLPAAQLLAATLPGRRSVILLSTALVEDINAEDLHIVIEHERTHLRFRHDVYRAAGAMLLAISRSFRPWVNAIGFELERWADERAAVATGVSRRRVAATIAMVGLSMEPQTRSVPAFRHGLGFVGDDPVRRVRALLSPAATSSPQLAMLALGGGMLVMAGGLVQIHHAATLFLTYCG
jgi:Zn-dependent protease with chaperone function